MLHTTLTYPPRVVALAAAALAFPCSDGPTANPIGTMRDPIAFERARPPSIFMGTMPSRREPFADWTEMVDQPEAWSSVRSRLSGLVFDIGAISGRSSNDDLAALKRLVDEHNLTIIARVGGTLSTNPLDGTTGERSAMKELRQLARFKDAGIEIDYLDLDGPIRRTTHPKARFNLAPLTLDQALIELVDYMKAVRQVHPHVQFSLLSNFPNWEYKGTPAYDRLNYGDYADVLPRILDFTSANGVAIRRVTVDNPYEHAIGIHPSSTLRNPAAVDWLGRILDLERYVESRGLEFHLIINSIEGGKTSAALFHANTLQYLDLYRESGGSPAGYIVQSWYDHPTTYVTESDPYTLTYLTREVIRKLDRNVTPRIGFATERARSSVPNLDLPRLPAHAR